MDENNPILQVILALLPAIGTIIVTCISKFVEKSSKRQEHAQASLQIYSEMHKVLMSVQQLESSTHENSDENKIRKMRSDLNKLWNLAQDNASLVYPDHLKELWLYSLQERGWKRAEADKDYESVQAFEKYVRKTYETFWVIVPEMENRFRKLSAYPYKNWLSYFFPLLRKEYNVLVYFVAGIVYILVYALYVFLLHQFGVLVAILTPLIIGIIAICLLIFITKLSAKYCLFSSDKRHQYTYRYYVLGKESKRKKKLNRSSKRRKVRSWLCKHLSHLCELLSK